MAKAPAKAVTEQDDAGPVRPKATSQVVDLARDLFVEHYSPNGGYRADGVAAACLRAAEEFYRAVEAH